MKAGTDTKARSRIGSLVGFKHAAGTSLKVVLVAIAVVVSFQARANDPQSDQEPLTVQDFAAAAQTLKDERNAPLDRFCEEMFPEPAFTPDIRVTLILTGRARFDDGTFAEGVFEGMEAAARCFGIITAYHTSDATDEKITALLDADDPPDIVLSVGFNVQEIALEVAELRPDVQFIGIDQAPINFSVSNYISVSAKDWQVGYLAGVAAALSSESKRVGVIAGPTYPPVVTIADGFEDGVAAGASDVAVQRIHLDSFIDPLLGAKTAENFAAQDVDVIFGAAGETGASAIKTAAAMDLDVIGVDLDQYYTTFEGGRARGSDRILTSALKRMDVGTFLSIAAVIHGGVQGGSLTLNVTNGGVAYSDFHDAAITEDFKSGLEQARLDLISGAVKTPD